MEDFHTKYESPCGLDTTMKSKSRVCSVRKNE